MHTTPSHPSPAEFPMYLNNPQMSHKIPAHVASHQHVGTVYFVDFVVYFTTL